MSPGAVRHWFFWFALACAAAIASAYVFAAFCGGVASTLGWDSVARGHQWFVAGVDSGGPAEGKLAAGDELVSINGSVRAAEFGPFPDLAGVGAGHTYSIEVRRDGQLRSYLLEIALAPQIRARAAVFLLISMMLFAVGLWIGLLKPDQKTTQVGFGAFMLGALLFLSVYLSAMEPSLSRPALFTAILIASCWQPFHLALGYDFASRFPSSVPENRAWRALRIAFYLGAAAFWFPYNLPKLANVLGLSSRSALLPSWYPLAAFDEHRHTLLQVLEFSAMAAMFLALIRNYRTLPDADARRRMRWAGVGLAAIFVPRGLELLVELLLLSAGRPDLANSAFFEWADLLTMLLVGVAAATLAYAIVRHRVLGIRVVIRRGVQYLLAKNVLRGLLFLPLIVFVLQVAIHPRRSIGDVLLGSSWIFYAFLAFSAGLSLRYHRQLGKWVDRKFFRSAYNQEEMLLELIERIKSNDSMDEVSATVAREMEKAFHPARIAIVYRKEATSRITVGYPARSAEAQSIAELLGRDIMERFEEAHTIRTFRELTPALAASERESAGTMPDLSEMLFVPMVGTDQRVAGLLLLGPKKSEEPYTKRDRDLLQAIAGQIAVVAEVLWLKERMREEHQVRVEVLGRLDDQKINLVNECPVCGVCYDRAATECAKDHSRLSLTLPVERIIDQKYRLDRRIGTGGMGAVFEALDLRLNRSVAVKIMIGRLFGNQEALRRFEREARTAAKLEHPNIVPIFDFGLLGGGGAFLVMQLVRGRNWRAELKRSGAIRPERASNWFDQLCDAMDAAHRAGVIHRDLKPENVIISREEKGIDRIKVLDFGLAKFRSQEPHGDQFSTGLGIVMGTLGYMCPEQRAGLSVDARGDIYAIGVMAVETLTGRRPPISGASREWMQSVLHAESLGGSAASQTRLLQLMDRCLAPEPGGRFDSIASFQADLVGLLRECQPAITVEESADDSETISLGE